MYYISMYAKSHHLQLLGNKKWVAHTEIIAYFFLTLGNFDVETGFIDL